MQYEYKINNKERIIYNYFKGILRVDELESAVLKLSKDSSFDPHYNILTDLRECLFELRPQEMEQFIRIFKEKFSKGKGKSAIIIDTPIETAISTIFQDLVKNVRRIQIFSTDEAAIAWLKSNL